MKGRWPVKRGEVWLVQLDPTQGAEIRKTRPCVVLTADGLGTYPVKIVAPITEMKKTRPLWHVTLAPVPSNGLKKSSVADVFQIRVLDEQRFIKKLGKLTAVQMEEIGDALMQVLDLR